MLMAKLTPLQIQMPKDLSRLKGLHSLTAIYSDSQTHSAKVKVTLKPMVIYLGWPKLKD